MLYLSSRMELCCSSWARVLSIWATCDCVASICDWLGAGPGRVVEVVAPAPDAVDSHTPRNAAITIALLRWARLRTVPRQFTAPTAQSVMAGWWQNRHAPVSVRLQPWSQHARSPHD